MALPSKETLGLIQWLATTDEEALHTLADLRGLAPQDLSSLTTLAHALLAETQVQNALSRQSRETLTKLASLSQTPDSLAGADLSELGVWGLVNTAASPPELLFPPDALAVLSGIDHAAPPPAVAGCGPHPVDSLESCARLVQAMLAQLGDVLDAMAKRPFAGGKNTTLSANGHKALAEVLGSGYDIEALVALAHSAGLVAHSPQGVGATEAVGSWRHESAQQQWLSLAGAWWAGLPEWLTAVVDTHPGINWLTELPALVDYHYPLLHQSERLSALQAQATLLGIIHQGCITPWGLELSAPTGSRGLEELFVECAPGVYATEDFSLVASGPLRLDHRVGLDAIAHRELGGLVPRYRVTVRSLVRALQAGATQAGIVATLEDCCITDVPDPLTQLVKDTCTKAGEITLHHSRNGTTLKVTRKQTFDELLVDPSLNGLRLRELDATTLVSPLPVERVNDFIVGSRYLALVHDDEPESGVPGAPIDADNSAHLALHAAVSALHASIQNAARHGVPPSLGSVLEVAIASKVPLDITVEMPGGERVSLIMEPRSVGGGRLRGVELKNSMEKTIPVSSIRGAVPWTPPVS